MPKMMTVHHRRDRQIAQRCQFTQPTRSQSRGISALRSRDNETLCCYGKVKYNAKHHTTHNTLACFYHTWYHIRYPGTRVCVSWGCIQWGVRDVVFLRFIPSLQYLKKREKKFFLCCVFRQDYDKTYLCRGGRLFVAALRYNHFLSR